MIRVFTEDRKNYNQETSSAKGQQEWSESLGEKYKAPQAKWTPALRFFEEDLLAIRRNPGASH